MCTLPLINPLQLYISSFIRLYPQAMNVRCRIPRTHGVNSYSSIYGISGNHCCSRTCVLINFMRWNTEVHHLIIFCNFLNPTMLILARILLGFRKFCAQKAHIFENFQDISKRRTIFMEMENSFEIFRIFSENGLVLAVRLS